MDKKINKFEEYEKMRSYLENPFYMPELERFFSKNQEGVVDDYYKEILTDTDNYTPGKVYAFSNENLDDLFNKLDLKDKKVLTVGSSGDQALYSLLYGAKDITIADLNIYTKPFVEFKIAEIVGSAPETLNALNELAAALGNDPNFAATVAKQIGEKASSAELNALSTAVTEGLAEILSAQQEILGGGV